MSNNNLTAAEQIMQRIQQKEKQEAENHLRETEEYKAKFNKNLENILIRIDKDIQHRITVTTSKQVYRSSNLVRQLGGESLLSRLFDYSSRRISEFDEITNDKIIELCPAFKDLQTKYSKEGLLVYARIYESYGYKYDDTNYEPEHHMKFVITVCISDIKPESDKKVDENNTLWSKLKKYFRYMK